MLRVTVEIIPYGRFELRRTLYEIDIVNDLTGNEKTGNYNVNIKGDTWNDKLQIKDFNRLKSFGALRLLSKVIDKYINHKD